MDLHVRSQLAVSKVDMCLMLHRLSKGNSVLKDLPGTSILLCLMAGPGRR